MKRIRIVGPCLVIVFALSAAAASAAWAAAPEFLNKNHEAVVKRHFASKGGLAKLESAGTVVECKSNSATGEIEKGGGNKDVANVVVTFVECASTNKKKEKCKVHTKGQVETIITSTLKGELGLVSTTEAKSGVGLDLVPAKGKLFVELEGTCLPTPRIPVTGSIIGEVTPVNTVARTGNLVYTTNKFKRQQISKFIGGKRDTLAVVGVAATQTQVNENTFEEEIEVT
jgi:hypothetical protein